MNARHRSRDLAVVLSTWFVVGTGVWWLFDDWPGSVLFPLAGFVWTAAPLAFTRYPTRPLLIVSGAALAVAISLLLLLAWSAAVLLELLFGFNLFPAALGEVAKVVPGVVAGIVTGLWRRRTRRIGVPVE